MTAAGFSYGNVHFVTGAAPDLPWALNSETRLVPHVSGQGFWSCRQPLSPGAEALLKRAVTSVTAASLPASLPAPVRPRAP